MRRRFHSARQGQNMRKLVWGCHGCGAWLRTKPAKSATCIRCGECAWAYFASESEASRWAQLRLMQRAGEISGLKVQPAFPIKINGVLVFTYRGDFQYIRKGGATVIEDVKPRGYRDPVYLLKKKAVQAAYGIEIREVEV